jgi:myo-inositol-1(or 4)-monophosphatase
MKRIRGEPDPAKLKTTCVEACLAAGAVLRKHFGKKLRVDEKKNAGLVTNADVEAEDAVLRVLRRRFPSFGVLTEEAGRMTSPTPGRFIVDPLDGTTNFVHGFPMFCVSLAAEWNGKVVVGVIYHPLFGEIYLGVRGQGATLNGRPLKVSVTPELHNSLLSTGFSYRKEEWLKREMESFEKLSGVARAIRRPGSAALDLAYTARGVFDGFWERRLSPWDVAAGSLLVEEAGGKVTDFQGNAFSVDTPEILATNGTIHPKLLKAMSRKR